MTLTATPGLETFAKVCALHDGTTNPGEKAAAAIKMQTLARKAGMSVAEAMSKLDAPEPQPRSQAQAAANAFNDFFNTPEMRARRAAREVERLARCAELLREYGSEDAVFADTPREAACRSACKPLMNRDPRPEWRDCYDLDGWNGIGQEKMPASVREAVSQAWPLPETVAAAWAEFKSADDLDRARCAFEPAYSPHSWAEARRIVLEGLLDTLAARSVSDLRARLSWLDYWEEIEVQRNADGRRAVLAALRADIEHMGQRLRDQDAETAPVQDGQQGAAPDADPSCPPDLKVPKATVQSGHDKGGPQSGHPLRRTNADKRRDVLALLDIGKSDNAPLTDREIARQAGVSPTTVGAIRRARP